MFKIVQSPQTVAWYYFTVIETVKWTVQLDLQEFKLSANSQYACVLGNVLIYNLMLIALAYVSSTDSDRITLLPQAK